MKKSKLLISDTRRFNARWLYLPLLFCALGCGQTAVESPADVAGGSSGGGATGGSSGGTAQQGSSAGLDSGGAANQQPPPAPCPKTPPTAGAACPEASMACGYGDAVRPDCRKFFLCSPEAADGSAQEPAWADHSGACIAPPKEQCPAQIASNGSPCTPNDNPQFSRVPCEYSNGALCYCPPCPLRGCAGSDHPVWQCFAPKSDDCPPVQPNLGVACDAPGRECSYGDACQDIGAVLFCRLGRWEQGGGACAP